MKKEENKNTLATTNNNSLVGNTLDKFNATTFGYYAKEFTENENGQTAIMCRTSDGALVERFETLDDESKKATKALDTLKNANGVVTLAVCYYANQLKTTAENCGFKSIGDYVASNIDNYKPVTVNQYARVSR